MVARVYAPGDRDSTRWVATAFGVCLTPVGDAYVARVAVDSVRRYVARSLDVLEQHWLEAHHDEM